MGGYTLEPYRETLNQWLPGGELLLEPDLPGRPDATLLWKRGHETVQFLIEHKRHLATQDVQLVANQLQRYMEAAPGRNLRPLLLAPYVRAQQGEFLRGRGIDYVDLAGNAHLEAPGVFVHVEGRRPTEVQPRTQARLTRAWVKTVMALLVRQELLNQPYRQIAEAAKVALGTVPLCMKDLHRRNLVRETQDGRKFTNIEELIALWVQAYGEVLRPKLRVRRFQMRETDMRARWLRLDQVLAQRHVPWALTGADGAAVFADFFRAPETEIYADVEAFGDRELIRTLVAQPAIYQANLLVIEPPGPLAVPEHRLDTAPVAPLLLRYAELRIRDNEQAHEAAEMLLPELLINAER